MVKILIPSFLRKWVGDLRTVETVGETVQQVIDYLDKTYPGVEDEMVQNGRLRLYIALVVNGKLSHLGLLHPLAAASEVRIIPVISGGTGPSASSDFINSNVPKLLEYRDRN